MATRPNKTRKVAASVRRFYASEKNRRRVPATYFLDRKNRDYPVRNPKSGVIDCNLVSAAIKRARMNKARGIRGSATVLRKAQTMWTRVCRKYTDGAAQ